MAVIIIGVLVGLAAAFVLGQTWIWRAAAAAILLGCVGLYAGLGKPSLGDQPLSARVDELRDRNPYELTQPQQLVLLQGMVRERPNDPQPHYFIGQIMLRNGRVDESIQAFQSSLRRDESFTPALRGLADAFVQADGGRVTQDTARLYAEVLRADPEDVQSAFMLGMGPWIDGERDLARRLWSESMTRMPEGSEAKVQLQELVDRIEAAMADVGAPAESEPPSQPGE